MLLEEGLDTGPILLQQTLRSRPIRLLPICFRVLATAGAPLVVETLAGLADGTINPRPQNHAGATLAPLLDREDGRMDFAATDRDRDLQSLARVSAVARRVHRSRREKADRASHGGGATEPDPRSRRLSGPGAGRACGAHASSLAPGIRGSSSQKCNSKARSAWRAAEFLRGKPLRAGCAAGLSAMAVISPARKAAHSKFCWRSSGAKRHSDDLLRGPNARRRFLHADRNLTTALVLGVLRWQIRLDHDFAPLLQASERKARRGSTDRVAHGRLPVAYLDRIPAHAAIDESVELTKQAGHGSPPDGQRRAAKDRREYASSCPTVLAVEPDSGRSIPAWMVERWTDLWPRGCAFNLQPWPEPAVPVVRFVDTAAEQELAESGIGWSPANCSTRRALLHLAM